ncbi:MAG: hypothetical protein AABW82_01040 [Nanoarchaeota archaeon]
MDQKQDKLKKLFQDMQKEGGFPRLLMLLRHWFPAWVPWYEIQRIGDFRYIHKEDIDNLVDEDLIERKQLPPDYISHYRISVQGLQFLVNIDSQKTNKSVKDLTWLMFFIGILQIGLMVWQIILQYSALN